MWYTRFLDRDETWVPQMQSTGPLPAPSTGETPRVDVPQRYPGDPAASIHAQTQYRRWRCRRGYDRSSGYSTLLSLLCPVRQDDTLGGASSAGSEALQATLTPPSPRQQDRRSRRTTRSTNICNSSAAPTTKYYVPWATRLTGILHGCLNHHTHYDEHNAWAHRTTTAA